MIGRLFNSAQRSSVGSREVVEAAIERSKNGRNVSWEVDRHPAQQWESGPGPEDAQSQSGDGEGSRISK